MKVLVTGTAGFIGYHTVIRFAELGIQVIGIDNINDYYDQQLKYDRLNECGINKSDIKYGNIIESTRWTNYSFMQVNLHDEEKFEALFKAENFDLVIHLAGQAGVRYSLENPKSYIESNVVGFLNILEGCRNTKVVKLLYASSSSVYGMSENELLSVTDKTDHPISLYAATKKSNELMSHAYSHLYGMQTIGLRFFTVYGPWGRPDMSPFLFADAILKGKPLNVFGHGLMKRDFTFIDDIIDAIFKIASNNITEKYKIYNIGNGSPVKLLDFIECIENELAIKSQKIMKGMQPGDVINTWADTNELDTLVADRPRTKIKDGVKKFIKWYKSYYNIV